jgi:SNF2 family DNA or RNA helicase
MLDKRVLVVDTASPETITQKIRKSLVIDRDDGSKAVAVHWGYNEACQLTEIIDDVPSPILRDYAWSSNLPPFEHQKTTASFLSLRPRAFCFSEQGTGKTASVIWAADYLMKLGKVKRVLVLCPLSIMKAAWQQDLFKFAMHRSCDVAHGTAKQRAKVIQSGCEFVVINYDGVKVVLDDLIAAQFDLIVVDEANAYKNAQTDRWKTLNKLVKAGNPRLWMLTGTPAAQSPVDAFGLAKLVNPSACPQYFTAFRDRVMYKLTQYKWSPKPDATEYVHNILQPAIRFSKEECLDLPAVTYIDRDAPLTPQQASYYKRLQETMAIEAAGEKISAVNAATNLNKLLQISGGAAYTDTREVVEFDVSNRIKVVQEVIDEARNKVLVFVPFTHTLQLLEDRLTRAGVSNAIISGQVSANKRYELVQQFQNTSDPQVLLIQPQAASHGLTLTAADTIVWYSPVTSVETYLQANARIDRHGQKNKMTVIHIKGSPVEARLYKMLQSRITSHEKLVDLYRQEIEIPA